MTQKTDTNHIKSKEYFASSDNRTRQFLEDKEDAERTRVAKTARLRAIRTITEKQAREA